ncbi:MAG: hypothetical protein H0T68_02380 [Gemmatimonadales bacterium]|nr:hypothetical protein [Gemmatimonadales bacterium]
MRSTTLTLTGAAMVAALLTGCGTEAGPTAETAPGLTAEAADHNAPVHFKGVEPSAFENVSACNGEVIAFSGEDTFQVTFLGTHYEFLIHTRSTGTGPVSGAHYTINDIYHENFQSPRPGAPQGTFTYQGMFHVTSDLPGLNFDGHFLFHMVTLPSGEVKITRDIGYGVCKG